jgi:hypothetical protein
VRNYNTGVLEFAFRLRYLTYLKQIFFLNLNSYPEILIFFVVGIPIVGDEMDQTDFDLQEKLEMEFEMFADIMQVFYRNCFHKCNSYLSIKY